MNIERSSELGKKIWNDFRKVQKVAAIHKDRENQLKSEEELEVRKMRKDPEKESFEEILDRETKKIIKPNAIVANVAKPAGFNIITPKEGEISDIRQLKRK